MSDGLQFGFSNDAAAVAVSWQESLKYERRMAAKTLEAYARDVSQFGEFLTDHLGQHACAADLAGLTTADFRSFMARRRKGGAESRTLARQLSAIRSFFRFAERNNHFSNAALSALRSPKLSHSVPKPLNIQAARRDGWKRATVPCSPCFMPVAFVFRRLSASRSVSPKIRRL
jgi:integrase/recombinase XerC